MRRARSVCHILLVTIPISEPVTDSMSQTGQVAEAFEAAVAAGLPLSWDWRQPVILAVSGGADSIGMLRAIAAIAPNGAQSQLLVAHVEYDLRDTAERDRRFVVEQAARLGLACHWRRLSVEASGETASQGREAAARKLRYDFFAALAHAHGARHVAVGHTLDDQAETILHRILRGTGIAGLAGMPRARRLAEGVSLVRPMLALRRQQVREYLSASRATWMEDESNTDQRFARNLLRHRVLAEVEQRQYPAATVALVRLGEQAAAFMTKRSEAVERLVDEAVERQPDGSLLLQDHLARLAAGDRELLADVFISLWRREGWPRQELSRRHLGRLTRMITDGNSATAEHQPAIVLPGAIRARWQANGIVLQPPPTKNSCE